MHSSARILSPAALTHTTREHTSYPPHRVTHTYNSTPHSQPPPTSPFCLQPDVWNRLFLRLPPRVMRVRITGYRDDRAADAASGIALDDVAVTDCATFGA